jgi:GH35 family endo-1,4-beta-xylanase
MRAFLALAAAVTATLLPAQTLVEGGSWSYSRTGGMQTIAVSGVPDGTATALRVATTIATPATPWDSQMSRVLPPALANGRWLRFRLWGRSSSKSRIGLIHELNATPYSKSLSNVIRLTEEWKEYAIAYQTAAYAAGTSALRIQTGFDVGTVELANIRLEDFGILAEPPQSINLDIFGGQSVDDSWKDAAQERIRKNRMGDIRVVVTDADGNPVPGASVKVEQLKHGFKFGTAVADGPLFANTGDGDRYRTELKRLFNYVVTENALKWQFNNGAGFPTADRMLQWFAENGLTVRGHVLVWPSYQYLPTSVRNLRGDELRQAIEAHVRDYVGKTRGRLVAWDVVNEAYTNTEVLRDGGRDLLWKSFQWAREENPDIDLVYNDYNISNVRGGANDAHRNGILAIVRELLDNGAPVTALGDQAHMNVPLTPIPRVLEAWDELSQFNLPIEITEFDVTFGGPRDEAAQAKYLEDYLTAAFSHPNIKSFLMWGFWDGAHWLASQGAGMFRRDWSARPMLDTYERLVFKDWWTNTEGQTGDDGVYTTRAFLGRHRVTVSIEGAEPQVFEIDLARDGGGEAAKDAAIALPGKHTVKQ